MTTIPTLELSDGNRIPAIGLGTYGLDDDAGAELVSGAIGAGYRLLDTALNYGNEAAVGDGMRRSGVPREELFLTTKLPGRHHGYDETIASFEESRASLGVDYVDLYLIHWPNPSVDRYVDSWRAFIELKERGLVRSIGVSNFTPAHPRASRTRRACCPSSIRWSCTRPSRRRISARSTPSTAS